jgi:CspA family cold shock protein
MTTTPVWSRVAGNRGRLRIFWRLRLHFPSGKRILLWQTEFACLLLRASGPRAPRYKTSRIIRFVYPSRSDCARANAIEYRVRFTHMATGTIKFFDTTKGFGFIAPEDGGKDVFVHISAVQNAGMDTLTEGQRVSYEIVTERGRSAAGNLQPA